jgi:SagB-type dehydrogenase family enzyme
MPGVSLDSSAPAPRLVGPGDEVVVADGARITPALRALAAGASRYERLIDRAFADAGFIGLRALHQCFEQLCVRGWLAHRVSHDGLPIVSAIPLTGDYRFSVESVGDRKCILSRFALVRRHQSEILLESPTAKARVILHDWRALAFVWRLADALRKTPARDAGHTLSVGARRSLHDLLWNAGLLTPIDGRDGAPSDEIPPLLQWEFHDLLFHSRTRAGRHDDPYGATYPFDRRVAPPPAVKPVSEGKRVSLLRPDLDKLARDDWTLTRTLETRRSQRAHGAVPITRGELGEFLYRTARVRSVSHSDPYETSRRVYPSGGATYALELYLTVRKCLGLVPGLYYYCPADHELRRLAGMTPAVSALLADAARPARSGAPQVLVTIAARFQRVSWKYSSIAYAIILKDVGVLLQTMYLVATSMELAACAIGGGNGDLFANAAGIDYYVEGSVGELILGRPPPNSR